MVPKIIGVLGFDGVRALDLAGPLEAFATARRNAERNGFRVAYTKIAMQRRL